MAAVLIAGAGTGSKAETPATGTVVRGGLDLAGKQVVLPEGEWTVAGRGYDQVVGLEDVPYGAIENVVLIRLSGERVDAFVLAQHNVIAIENGWGVAPECVRSDLLGSVVYDGAEGHSFCGFVSRVPTGVDGGSAKAWQASVTYAAYKGLSLPPAWLMAGYRRSDLTDLLDVRYHFDPTLAGVPAAASVDGEAWSRGRIFGNDSTGGWGVVGGLMDHAMFWRPPQAREPAASPATQRQAEIVNDLRDWLARMRYAVDLGFENRAAAAGTVPMPWSPAVELFRPELAVRLASLNALVEAGVLPPPEYARQRAIAEGLSAPTAALRWTAEELTAVKALTDQVSGAIGYFGADLLYTGTIETASQIWALDQLLDAIRYTVLEYGWQRLGPRRLTVDQPLSLPGAGN